MTTEPPKYQRVLLKVSGETLAGPQRFGLDPATLKAIAREIHEVANLGVGVGIVVGGGINNDEYVRPAVVGLAQDRLYGGTVAAIHRMPHHTGAGKLGHLRSAISAAIVNNQDFIRMLPGLQDNAADMGLLVVGRHANDDFWSG